MPRVTAATKPTGKGVDPKSTAPKPEAVADLPKPTAQEEAMLQRHVKADAASLDLRLETMAHALIFDINCLPDVINRLYNLVPEEHRAEIVNKFFDYYVPRLEVLIEEDWLLGNITALSDLGEWLLHDSRSHGDYRHYTRILGMLKKPLDVTPVQMAKLLERSAVLEREETSRGESWIPKSSRRASAQ